MDEADVVILDGAGRPYEWQPTISAADYADNRSLVRGSLCWAEAFNAYIVAYNLGASDERFRRG